MNNTYQPGERRPIATRDLAISGRIASWLAKHGASPNGISVMSAVFGLAAGACAAGTGWCDGITARMLWLGTALFAQLRLLANLFDGMVAIESGKASPVGELFNEMPDRISDMAIFIGLGLAAGGEIVWAMLAALTSVATAYVRVQCALAGGGQHYIGPMAKPHRMFLVTMLCLYMMVTPGAWQTGYRGLGPAGWLCVVVTLGASITMIRRTLRASRKLKAAS